MTSKERMACAMRRKVPDRVPVMCQLALGHYFLHAGVEPIDAWYTTEGFAEALIRLQQRYRFDGILINLPGRDPNYTSHIERIERGEGESIIRWKNGCSSVFPDDDNPHYYRADGSRFFPAFAQIKPEELHYIEPWGITDISYPYRWDFDSEPRPFDDYFPPYHFDTIKRVKATVGHDTSLHSEIYSPWSQFLELLNYEQALMAMLDDPGKVHACLGRLADGTIDLARRQAACGVDAILISSAFAGGGFISPQQYREFVLPYERRIVTEVKNVHDVPMYTHTCGSIGDRLDLIVATGTDGIDTLDPPPLGTVELEDAKRILANKTFIKGNIDPVHTLLQGSLDDIRRDVQHRIEVGKPGGGYILSTACSVSPHTPPQHIEQLALLAEEFGQY